MRQLSILLIITLITCTHTFAQSGKTCVPFDSTFHYLKPKNLNFWIQAGILTTGQAKNMHVYNSVGFNLNYVPIKYLQTGISTTKRLPVPNNVSFWKSYDLSIYARYSFIRMDCAKTGIFANAGYNKTVQALKNGEKNINWAPYTGVGIYKDLGKGLLAEFDSQIYFNDRPNQMSLSLIWKFMNMKIR